MVDVPLSHTEAVERDAVSQNGAGTGAGGQEAAWEKAMSLSAESANAPEALHAVFVLVKATAMPRFQGHRGLNEMI